MRSVTLGMVLGVLALGLPVAADVAAQLPTVTEIGSDSGVRGGQVSLPALPELTDANAVRKQFVIESLAGVQSAELLLFAALRDLTWDNDYSFDAWEWIFFDLNGYGWVRRVEDLPLYRRTAPLWQVEWDDVQWTPLPIPEVAYLQEGINVLTIWNNNLPGKSPDKHLVIAYDDGGPGRDSFARVDGEWVNAAQGAQVEGVPPGEWMIRLRLHRLQGAAAQAAALLGPEALAQAQEEGKVFLWGLTDPMRPIFADRPYPGGLENEWELDAARGEYESCQLVIMPVASDLPMADVSVGAFRSADGVELPAEATEVRLVRYATVNARQWPDPLPPATPWDIPLGRVQPYLDHRPRAA